MPDASATMRVLFITYYFPPSGGPGVQRSLKFVRYLPDYGWSPVVVTVRPEDASYPATDLTLEREVHASIRVVRTPAWDPYAAYGALLGKEKKDTVGVGFLGESDPGWKERLGRWIRANIFVPDARVGWIPHAIRAGGRLLREGDFDLIFTTGPPHSTHLVGLWLARRHGVPWMADFRDPWTGIDYAEMLPAGRLARRLDAALERRVLRSSNAVSAVSPSMIRGLTRRQVRGYDLIPNGFDSSDFRDGVEVEREVFLISHIGSLNEARNPAVLWRALAAIDAPSTMPELRVRLVGKVDPAVFDHVRGLGLSTLMEHIPYVPHDRAADEMMRAAVLLLLINRVQGAEGILTGKIFEYIGSGRPVLCIGPGEGDARKILRETGAGEVCEFDAVGEVSRALQEHYSAWKSGTPIAGASPENADGYSRRRQSERLAAIFERVVRDSRGDADVS